MTRPFAIYLADAIRAQITLARRWVPSGDRNTTANAAQANAPADNLGQVKVVFCRKNPLSANTVVVPALLLLVKPLPSAVANAKPRTPAVSAISPTARPVSASSTMTRVPRGT